MNYIPIKHEKVESKAGVKGVVTYVEIGRDSHKPCLFTVQLKNSEIVVGASYFKRPDNE